MVNPIPDHLKKIWDAWNVRWIILAASFAIGHIANSQIPKPGPKDKIDCSFVENIVSHFLWLRPYESKKGLSLKQKALHYLRSIFECFWPCIEKIIDFLGAKEFVTQLMYVESNQFPKKLWNFIFDELVKKSRDTDDAETTKMICSARGAYVIQESQFKGEVYQKIAENYIENVTFDESLLLWHVATELCYHTKEKDEEANESKADNPTQEDCHDVSQILSSEDCRHISQILSDYMIYLLVMQPTMMSAVAGMGQIKISGYLC